ELKLLASNLDHQNMEELSGTELLELKQHFYRIILDLEENNVLRGILGVLNNRVSLLRVLSLSQAGRSKYAFKELEGMIAAIVNRDVDAASQATKNHIENAARKVLSLLQS